MAFFDRLAAAVDLLGLENADIAWGIAGAPFESDDDVNEFLAGLVGDDE